MDLPCGTKTMANGVHEHDKCKLQPGTELLRDEKGTCILSGVACAC